jgi:BRCA1-A complex subunit BRE
VLEAVSLIDVRRHFIEALAGPLGRPVEADPVYALDTYFQIAMIALFSF